MGQSPYPGKSLPEVITFVTSGKILPRTQEIPSIIYEIMLSCWQQDPEKRPSFSELVLTFSRLIGEVPDEVMNFFQILTFNT